MFFLWFCKDFEVDSLGNKYKEKSCHILKGTCCLIDKLYTVYSSSMHPL